MTLPSRKKQPGYYLVVKEPIDLSMIKQRVKTGYYDHIKDFNDDLMLLFSNVEVCVYVFIWEWDGRQLKKHIFFFFEI